MICKGINEKDSLNNGKTKEKNYRFEVTKKLVMQYAFLIEECKDVKQNDLVIYTCADLLRTFFEKDVEGKKRIVTVETIELFKQVLGGYKRQILDNNFDLKFLENFDFKLAHFLCQGVNGEIKQSCTESFKYLHQSADTKVSVKLNIKYARHSKKVKQITKELNPVYVADYEGWTALMEACEYGGYDIVEYLLDNDIPSEYLNAVDANGYTAIDVAWYNRDLDNKNTEGKKPRLKIIELLIDKVKLSDTYYKKELVKFKKSFEDQLIQKNPLTPSSQTPPHAQNP